MSQLNSENGCSLCQAGAKHIYIYSPAGTIRDKATFKRGLAELETAKLIAKTVRKGRYFVNPSFVFNGDRVAFSTVIERKKESLQDELEARGQLRLEV